MFFFISQQNDGLQRDSQHSYSIAGEPVYWEDELESSNFIIQPYRRANLKEYMRQYSTDNDVELWDDRVASVLEQNGFRAESAPRSVYSVNKLYGALAKYAPECKPKVVWDDPHLEDGIKLAYASFAKPKDLPNLVALPLTLQTIHEITSNEKGSAGMTAFGKQKRDAEEEAYQRSIQIIKGERKPEPCVAFKRTQFGGKTRLVWGYPYSMTAIEGLFARPIIDHFKNANSPMSFGHTTGWLGTRLRVSSYRHKWAYSTDISSFDSSLSGDLIHVAFKILRTWFDLNAVEPTTGVKYGWILSLVEKYFITTPIVMPNGMIYKGKRHGVPSGSYFTQWIDSVCNCIICGTISSRFRMNVEKDSINILGDDLLFWTDKDVELMDVAEYASGVFGVRMNANKSMKFRYDEAIHYLGRDWDRGVPTYSIAEILKRLTQPESFRKYSPDPAVAEREARLLILQFASQYYAWYEQMWNIWSNWYTTWDVGCDDLERMWLSNEEMIGDIEHLSGLMRFKRKYVTSTPMRGEPVAMSFWK